MKALFFTAPGSPLELREVPIPTPAPHQVLLRIHACGICRTDRHILDGEILPPHLPLIPGHQIVGTIVSVGSSTFSRLIGQRRGLPWLGGSCGHCFFCTHTQENLCDAIALTGFHYHGGYAEYCLANPDYLLPIPEIYSHETAAPLLCAGIIGYRALKLAGEAHHIGFYGFGSSAHILSQVAHHQGKKVYAFTRPGDLEGQKFARTLGAVWAGDTETPPPNPLDAILIFAPIGALIPKALEAVRKGGIVVSVGIHMSDIPTFCYSLLWGERVLRSVTHLTRRDGEEFLTCAAQFPLKVHVTCYPLTQANEALQALKQGTLTGSAVLTMG